MNVPLSYFSQMEMGLLENATTGAMQGPRGMPQGLMGMLPAKTDGAEVYILRPGTVMV